jgi:hypothetical protein
MTEKLMRRRNKERMVKVKMLQRMGRNQKRKVNLRTEMKQSQPKRGGEILLGSNQMTTPRPVKKRKVMHKTQKRKKQRVKMKN